MIQRRHVLMGSLAVAGEGAGGGGGAADAGADAVGDTGADAAGGDERGPNITEPTPGSRREEAFERRLREETERISKTFDERLSTREREWEARVSQAQAEAARIQGYVEAMQRQGGQQQQGPTPAELKKRAKEALDAGRFSDYEALNEQANEVKFQQQLNQALEQQGAQILQQVQQSQPRQYHPFIQGMLVKHPQVAARGPYGESVVTSKANELMAARNQFGQQPPPDVMAKAFELAEGYFTSQQAPSAAAYNPSQSAGALAGVPGSRQGAGGAGQAAGPKLTDEERGVLGSMRNSDGSRMSAEDFVMWRDEPEKAAAAEKKKRRR